MSDAGPSSPPLDPEQEKQAEDYAPLRGVVIHRIIREEGETDLQRPAAALLWSGLAAGLSMGFSFAVQALLKAALPAEGWAHAVASFGYVVGFVVVVLGRQQLFTESTLTATLPALTRRDAQTTLAMLRLWAIVLVANLAGTWLFAAALAYASPLPPEASDAMKSLLGESLANPFGVTLVKAVFAGWLIGLMAWLLPPAGSAKLLIIVLLTWVVALAKLSHIIAGSTETAYGVLTGGASAGDYLVGFLLPTLIGNVLGGAALVALLNHAPVRHDVAAGPPS
ncbi:MAG: formate/nitrite transporter family protein [Phenylobacterium sp.]